MRKTGDTKGLTLIEILIALGILTILLLSVYGTFFSVHSAIEASDGKMVRFREVRIFFDMIRKEVEGCYVNGDDEYTMFRLRDRDIFGVQASEVGFTAFVPYGKGLLYVEYRLDKKTKSLQKRVSGIWKEEIAEQFDILEDVVAFRVEAFNGKRWTATFDTELTKRLPLAVRIELTFNVDGGPMTLTETIVPKLRG
jgi:prepilin-type N-terminal cleavage/methylation domain-containing protein